jgi:3-phosphoshikimate 1-carboxyvinyltransferase
VLISPAKRFCGSISVPGDKSISHRAAMIAAIANGTSHIKNYSTSADCAATLSCLEKLGVRIERKDHEVIVHGVGANGLREPAGDLDCGNSGTTMRLLAGILATQEFESTLTGDESLCSRPMQRIIEPLEMLGAQVTSANGRAPLTIRGQKPPHAIAYELRTASAQVKSCILLAALSAVGTTLVIENETTRDHTERMLRWFEVPCGTFKLDQPANSIAIGVTGPVNLNARDVLVPGDISSAAYFIAAAGLLANSSLEITSVGLNPTRTGFLDESRKLGFEITASNESEQNHEPSGSLHVNNQGKEHCHKATPYTVSEVVIPQLIDELPLLAVVGSQIAGGIEIRNAKELRVKESDRIAATAQGLRSMGCEVEEFDDGLRVKGASKLRGARIDSRGDHRIAMSFAIAALVAEGETEIIGADCVAVSFPEFFDLLESVTER